MPELKDDPVRAVHRVFLSYSTKDEKAASGVKSALQNESIEVFDALASQREMWGANIGDYLREIITSRVTGIVVFLSKNYQESTWCKSELDTIEAASKEKDDSPLVLPIRLDDSPVPEGLRDRVYLELKGVSPNEIAKIAKSRLESCTRSELLLAALPDEELYQRFVQTRDAAAANLLFERLYPIIRTACSRFGVGGADVEDIAQDTIVKILHRAPELKEVRNFRAWVWAVARNQAMHSLRRSIASKRVQFVEDEDSFAERGQEVPDRGVRPSVVPDVSPSPDESLDTAEMVKLIKQAIEELPPEEREIVELRYNSDLSFDEISQLLGVSPASLRVRWYRTLRKLKHHLQPDVRNG